MNEKKVSQNKRENNSLEHKSLEDKINLIACTAISAAACVSGGFILDWSRARGISPEYETLMSYGPILLSAGMFGIYGGVEAYSQAKEKPLPSPSNHIYFAGKMAAASAVMGGFLGGYNQICFEIIGFIAGKIAP